MSIRREGLAACSFQDASGGEKKKNEFKQKMEMVLKKKRGKGCRFYFFLY